MPLLSHDVYDPDGPETGPPLVIAHGLFGSARNWRAISRQLARGRRVVAVDMRNHGRSFRSDSQSYPDMAGDLEAVIREVCGGTADLLGHSMGGKAAMLVALGGEVTLRRLVIGDIAPVRYTHSHAGYIAAMRRVDLSQVRSRHDADAQLARDEPDAGMRAFLLQSLDLDGETPRWRLNLDVLEAAMDQILDFPEVTGTYDGPVLFLSGGASHYVGTERRDPIRALFPRARFASIPGAGHWLHAEKPREFIAAVAAYLDHV